MENVIVVGATGGTGASVTEELAELLDRLYEVNPVIRPMTAFEQIRAYWGGYILGSLPTIR